MTSSVTSQSRVSETGASVPRSNPRGVTTHRGTARDVNETAGMDKAKRAKLRSELTRFAYAGPEHASQLCMDAAVDHAIATSESITSFDEAIVWPALVNVSLAIRDAFITGAIRFGLKKS